MKTKKKTKNNALRERAEQVLAQNLKAFQKISSKDVQSLIHELQVHQVELEMQNEELRTKQAELEELNAKYVNLYEFAPVGYFTLDRKGRVLEVNLTGVTLLGLPRSKVVGMPFTVFLDKDSIASFLRHVMEVFSSGVTQACELVLHPRSTKRIQHVLLESISIEAGNDRVMRCALTDVTERKLAELEVLRTRQELSEANEHLQHLSDRLLILQEEEKRRVALEVHDGFASSLAAIRIQLSKEKHAKPEKGEAVTTEETLNQLQIMIDEARRIQSSLWPSVLDDLGLIAALTWLCREFRESNRNITLETEFRLQESETPEQIKLQVFRIAQEALDNIAKHAKADFVRVSLTQGTSSIALVITDTGRGFDVKKAFSRERSRRGLGLSSMKERAALSGGTLRIESAPGKGATIRVSWPAPPELVGHQ